MSLPETAARPEGSCWGARWCHVHRGSAKRAGRHQHCKSETVFRCDAGAWRWTRCCFRTTEVGSLDSRHHAGTATGQATAQQTGCRPNEANAAYGRVAVATSSASREASGIARFSDEVRLALAARRCRRGGALGVWMAEPRDDNVRKRCGQRVGSIGLQIASQARSVAG